MKLAFGGTVKDKFTFCGYVHFRRFKGSSMIEKQIKQEPSHDSMLDHLHVFPGWTKNLNQKATPTQMPGRLQ